MSEQRFDVLVAGGGTVGAVTAALLARCGFSVAVVDARPPGFDAQAGYQLRMSAVSPGSVAVLQQAGAWAEVEKTRACAYRRMLIEDPQAGRQLEFEASVFGLERLGTIVENDLLRMATWQQLQASGLVQLYCPAKIRCVEQDAHSVKLTLDDDSRLAASLLVACDGAGSQLRQWMGVPGEHWVYNQAALVCVAEKQQANPGVAWQRFLPGGPLAFLPLQDGRSSIVWTLPASQARQLLQAGDDEFTYALGQASEGWLGALETCGPRASFPLSMRLSRQWVSGRTVLLGDAAHVVHPLAGQGLNIGLADSAALAQVLVSSRRQGLDLADARRLRAFERWRKSESGLLAAGIHAIGGLFRIEALAPLRGFGLKLVGDSWFAREAFVRRAAGQGESAPRLARGDTVQALLRETPGAGA
jgi:2-octaprenyl-3-methyl-6-methoxy-1,4-benzoquinol hydroxylase